MDISIGMVGEGGTKWAKAPVDEQAERIKESVRDYYKNPQEYSFADLEDMFEDRDPIEFL